MNSTWKALTATAAGVAMAVSGVGVAQAAPTSPTASIDQVVANYSDEDVVEFLVFGEGPMADANRNLVEKLGLRSEAAPEGMVHALAGELTEADPDFHTHVVEPLTSGNPYAIREGLNSFSKTMNSIVSPGTSGDISTNCVVWGVVNVLVAIELVVAGALVVVVAYRPSGDDSRFTQDQIAASLTALH